jgi:endonuclease/exonuclease/phosphatase family metal-dependent hydrolase
VDAQARWLGRLQPDIVLLQEVEQFTSYGNFDHVERLRQVLRAETGRSYHAYWANGSGTAYGRGQVTAILSVFPLSSVAARAMPYRRPLTMANVEVLPGKVIALFTVHLASWKGYDRERSTQVAELVYWLTTRGARVRLIGGDWNLTPDSVPLAPIRYWYTDLYDRAKGLGVFRGPDDTRPFYKPDSVVGRIDALYLGKSWPSWMQLTGLEHVNTGLSDHYAVIADFAIR